jgi:hypothetical protein
MVISIFEAGVVRGGALDAEHRLLLSVVQGGRTSENALKIVQEVKERTGGRTDILFTSDEHEPYKGAIERAYIDQETGKLPEKLVYATVKKERKGGKIVKISVALVFGLLVFLEIYLKRSLSSHSVNTSFVERHNGTDRHQNKRKQRKSYCFSKDQNAHDLFSYFIAYSYNFCWFVRTLRIKGKNNTWLQRTPAMAAKLTDHIWSLSEWITFPSKPCCKSC